MTTRLTLKSICGVLAVTMSAFLTLVVALNAPSAQANHQTHFDQVGGDTLATTTAGSNDVTIASFAYNPATITVTAGSTVMWTNTDPFTHTTTSDVGSLDPWDSGPLGQNGTFSKVFNTPGIYHYHCTVHFTTMFGTVVVTGPQPQPPTEAIIDGPTDGVIGQAYTFTATISPVTATQPITYVWRAANQSTVTHHNGLSDTVVFTWTAGVTGTQWITVTASNSDGSVAGNHFIIIGASKIYLPLILR
jgi:plastocyanin